MPPKNRHNDNERENWANNHPGLYRLFEEDGCSMRNFVRGNRELIDSIIDTTVPSFSLK